MDWEPRGLTGCVCWFFRSPLAGLWKIRTLPQQLLPVSAAGSGRRRCCSSPLIRCYSERKKHYIKQKRQLSKAVSLVVRVAIQNFLKNIVISMVSGFRTTKFLACNFIFSPQIQGDCWKTVAFFYTQVNPIKDVEIRVEKPLFYPLWFAFQSEHECFPMRKAMEAYRQINRSKSTLFIFTGRRCEDGCFSYWKDSWLYGHVKPSLERSDADPEIQRAAVHDVVAPWRVELHHQRFCGDLPRVRDRKSVV